MKRCKYTVNRKHARWAHNDDKKSIYRIGILYRYYLRWQKRLKDA